MIKDGEGEGVEIEKEGEGGQRERYIAGERDDERREREMSRIRVWKLSALGTVPDGRTRRSSLHKQPLAPPLPLRVKLQTTPIKQKH